MLDLFLANSRRGLGSSETTVAVLPVLTPFSLPKSLCYRLGGKAFSSPSVLCFYSYANCRGCQERAGMLKERNKWQWSNMVGSLLTWRPALHLRKLEPTVTPHLSLLSCFFLFKIILNKRINYMLKLYYRIKLGRTFFILTFNFKLKIFP